MAHAGIGGDDARAGKLVLQPLCDMEVSAQENGKLRHGTSSSHLWRRGPCAPARTYISIVVALRGVLED